VSDEPKAGLAGCGVWIAGLFAFAAIFGLMIMCSDGKPKPTITASAIAPKLAAHPKPRAVPVEMHEHDAGSALTRSHRCTVESRSGKPVTAFVDGGTLEIANGTKCEVETYGRHVPVLLLDGPHAGQTVRVWGLEVRREGER
jgi:hypothetical protein